MFETSSFSRTLIDCLPKIFFNFSDGVETCLAKILYNLNVHMAYLYVPNQISDVKIAKYPRSCHMQV